MNENASTTDWCGQPEGCTTAPFCHACTYLCIEGFRCAACREAEREGYLTDRSWASGDNMYAISATTDAKMHDLGRWIEVLRTDDDA